VCSSGDQSMQKIRACIWHGLDDEMYVIFNMHSSLLLARFGTLRRVGVFRQLVKHPILTL
jgi:hypothetical protein